MLLVIDYAETRPGLGELLRAMLDDSGRIRVLLLARSLGEWWDRLTEESASAVAQLLSTASPIHLDAPIEDVPDADLAAAAVPFFAAELGVPAPSATFDLPGHRVPVLVLHAAALVAVLRSMTSPPGPLRVAVTEGVLGELLGHEARYWRRSAASCGLPDDGRILKPVIAAAILLGAVDLEEATAVAARVPDLAGSSAGDLRRWTRWLYDLYPGGPAGSLGSVQPDLLAEHHAATQLTADPGLARTVLAGMAAGQASQALTVLARAWQLHEDTGPVIETAMRADLAGLALPAGVAVQTQPRVGLLLASALRSAPATLEDLIAIKEALPYPSIALARADLAVTQRIRRELPQDTDKQTMARWARIAGTLLVHIGQLTEALPLTEEAVAMYRDLAMALPDRYRADLTTSLSGLGDVLTTLGRNDEAEAARREAEVVD